MIEYILNFSITRRWLCLSLIVMITGAGIWSYQSLPIDAVPDITNIQVQINTEAPGYSPLEVEQRITYPVETAIAGIPHLSYTRSLSRYGLSQVTVVFDERTDLYFARALINERLTALKTQLPDGLSPMMGPIATGLGEIFTYSIEAASDALQDNGQPYDALALREIQDWIIKPQLAMVKGITEINTIGGYTKQYHILPDPQKLLAFSLTLQDISRALQHSNANRGAGYIEQNGQQLLVRSPGQLQTLSDIEKVVVKVIDTAPVMLQDVAEVAIGKALRTGAATRNGKETVLGTAMMLVGENAKSVSTAMAHKLEDVKTSLPQGITVHTVYNRTTLVDKAIATVQKNLVEGALLVIVVLFLLLGNMRAALITAAVIPLSMLATITGMVQAGVSANLMSLGALDFGIIVDGTVIIVENAIRRLSLAYATTPSVTRLPLKERLHIVFDATNEVIRPSLFGVLIITVVYIPLFSLTGVEGKMFHPMATTVVFALLAAMFISITIVPAAIAVLITGRITEKESPFIAFAKKTYQPVLKAALRFHWAVLIFAVSLVMSASWLATTLGTAFIPTLNEGDIALHAMRTPGTSLTQSIVMQTQIEKHLQAFPEIDTVFAKIGTPDVATDPMPPNVADTFVMLKPVDQWPDPTQTHAQLVEKIEQALLEIPGNNYEFTQPIQMRFNELISGVRSDLGIKLFGDDLSVLVATADDILATLNTVEGVADAKVEQVTGLPTLAVIPNRIALARYQLNVADLQDTVATAIAGEPSGFIFNGDRRFDIIVKLSDTLRENISELENFPITLPNGHFVPLSEVATLNIAPAPNQISRENGKRRIVITANVRGRDLGSFVEDVKHKIANNVNIPAGYWLDYGGTFKQLQSASARLSLVVPITLCMIFGLLMLAFGSFKDAAIIFTGVPLALTGGIFALWLRDIPLSISAGVGFIALSGVAVLNGLVMLAFIRERWHHKGDLQQAIVDGALTRLRPVLMTALVASLGFVPMALNMGTGAEVQRPLATVVIGGIISSTLLTLCVLPVLYQLLHRRDKHKT